MTAATTAELRAIVFDMDGLLADTETRLSRRPMLGPDFESPAQMPPPSDFRL